MRAALCLLLLVAGCSTIQPREAPPGERAAAEALKVIGTPYRFAGASPQSGFDCSGLVSYSYRQAGVALPHNTDALRAASQPIAARELRAGDLVFFDLEGKTHSHVGIYLGDGTFVHAPSTGKDVRRDRLESPYWKVRISDNRRPTSTQ